MLSLGKTTKWTKPSYPTLWVDIEAHRLRDSGKKQLAKQSLCSRKQVPTSPHQCCNNKEDRVPTLTVLPVRGTRVAIVFDKTRMAVLLVWNRPLMQWLQMGLSQALLPPKTSTQCQMFL